MKRRHPLRRQRGFAQDIRETSKEDGLLNLVSLMPMVLPPPRVRNLPLVA